MPEHRIRLRGGWDCQYRERDDPDGPEVVRRVDLPVVWTEDFPRRLRLTRQFGRPPVDPASERVELELRDVPGLTTVRLNGQAVSGVVAEGSRSIRLDEALLPRNMAIQLFRALIESAAGEQGARMSSMDNATRNAGDMIDRLTIQFNRSRQAAITKELIEIISGAEAL